MPHHAVIRESRVSTKVRIVFNASNPGRNGNSLNSCLFAGPKLQPDIAGVLLHFRAYRIVLSGDTEFSQTKILSTYYPFQQYLWRRCDQKKEPQRFMTRLMFGITSSPFCAMAAIQEHCENVDMIKKYPNVIHKIYDYFYVDDLLTEDESEEKVVDFYHVFSAFFKAGG